MSKFLVFGPALVLFQDLDEAGTLGDLEAGKRSYFFASPGFGLARRPSTRVGDGACSGVPNDVRLNLCISLDGSGCQTPARRVAFCAQLLQRLADVLQPPLDLAALASHE